LAPVFTEAVPPVPALGRDDVPEADDVLEADAAVRDADDEPEADRLLEGGDVQAASSRSTTIKNPSRRMGDLFSRCAPSVTRDAGAGKSAAARQPHCATPEDPCRRTENGLLPPCGRRRLPAMDAIDVTMGDIARTAAQGPYSPVYLVFNTIFTLVTQDDQVRCFENAARHLAGDGVFVVEAAVPGALIEQYDYVSPEHERDGPPGASHRPAAGRAPGRLGA
jgi:hypothetical protein